MTSIIEALQDTPVTATGPQTLHLLQPQDRARWDAFVRATPAANAHGRQGVAAFDPVQLIDGLGRAK